MAAAMCTLMHILCYSSKNFTLRTNDKTNLDARIAHNEVTITPAVPLQIAVQLLETDHTRHFFAHDRASLANLRLHHAIPTSTISFSITSSSVGHCGVCVRRFRELKGVYRSIRIIHVSQERIVVLKCKTLIYNPSDVFPSSISYGKQVIPDTYGGA